MSINTELDLLDRESGSHVYRLRVNFMRQGVIPTNRAFDLLKRKSSRELNLSVRESGRELDLLDRNSCK